MAETAKFLCNGWPYYGLPRQLVGGVWVHEEPQRDGTIKLIPFVPLHPEATSAFPADPDFNR